MGAFEILDLFLTNFGSFEKIVDISVWVRVQRSRYLNKKVHVCGPFCTPRGSEVQIYISQHIQNRFKKYPQIDCRAFAFSRLRYSAANRTLRDIPIFGSFGDVKIQGGQCPLCRPPIKISLQMDHCWGCQFEWRL